MSVIEDSRKVLQDFIAPELRAIAVRLDALEKRHESLDHKLDEVDRRAEKRNDSLGLKMDEILRQVEKRLDEANRLAEKRHSEMMDAVARAFEISLIQERLARLESKDSTH